ncbi:hypothetical protein D3C71_1933400 [compost metagenome]
MVTRQRAGGLGRKWPRDLHGRLSRGYYGAQDSGAQGQAPESNLRGAQQHQLPDCADTGSGRAFQMRVRYRRQCRHIPFGVDWIG